MPMFPDDQTPTGPRLIAHGSIAIEIDWCLSAAHRASPELEPAALFELYRRRPDLAEDVRSLWGPDETLTYPGYLELSALAYDGGLLFSTDSEVFLAKLDELCAHAPDDLPFSVEEASDAERLRARLRVLRRSPKRRARYIEVVTAVWNEAGALWEAEGRAAVEAAVAERETIIARRPSVEEFASVNDSCCGERLNEAIAALGADDALAVVPAFFTRKGLTADFPGLVIIGIKTGSLASAARARTETLARRLKAISDPTRLAILDAVSRHDLTVGDVAGAFDLAQPTVSNHVKQLRDAGIVHQVSEGGRRRLELRRDVVDEMLDSLGQALQARPTQT